MINRKRNPGGRRARETDRTLRRLIKAPETASRIFEFAESLYFRDETAERLSFADIRQVELFLKQTENDLVLVKKQFLELTEIESSFETETVQVGF